VGDVAYGNWLVTYNGGVVCRKCGVSVIGSV